MKEFVCVPFANKIPDFKLSAGELSLLRSMSPRHVFVQEDTREAWQHTTSIERLTELALTHPLVSTTSRLMVCRVKAVLTDERGRASEGPQSPYELSLSLAVTGKVIRVGLSTRGVDESLCALWWSPKAETWTEHDTQLARAAFFDLAELTAEHLFPGELEQMLQI